MLFQVPKSSAMGMVPRGARENCPNNITLLPLFIFDTLVIIVCESLEIISFSVWKKIKAENPNFCHLYRHDAHRLSSPCRLQLGKEDSATAGQEDHKTMMSEQEEASREQTACWRKALKLATAEFWGSVLMSPSLAVGTLPNSAAAWKTMQDCSPS